MSQISQISQKSHYAMVFGRMCLPPQAGRRRHTATASLQINGGTPSLLRRETPVRNVQRFAVLQGGLVGHDAHRHETSRNPRIDDGLAVFGDG